MRAWARCKRMCRASYIGECIVAVRSFRAALPAARVEAKGAYSSAKVDPTTWFLCFGVSDDFLSNGAAVRVGRRRLAFKGKTAGASLPRALTRGRVSAVCGGENRAMPNTGQQHFERVVKKFLEALRRVISRPRLIPVRVRR